MSHTPAWWAPARPPFLLIAPCCIALAVAGTAWWARQAGGQWAWSDAWLALLGALAAMVSINALNEYLDSRSGLDALTTRTPFSGGSGALQAHPAWHALALWMGLVSLLLTLGVGLYFLWMRPERMLALLPIGLLGVALVVSYTPWITRQPLLCLLAPGFGIGPLMMLGTQAVLIGHLGGMQALLSVLPWCLGNNLLLLNQYPDVAADRQAGRRTLPIVWGVERCWTVLAGQFALAYAVLTGLVASGHLPPQAALGLLTAPLAVAVVRGARRHASQVPALLPFMGMNVAISLLTPVLVAAGLMWAALETA